MYSSNIKQLYELKRISLQKVLHLVPDGAVIVSGSAGQEPITFFSRLHTIAPRLTHPLQIYNTGLGYQYPFGTDPACKGKIHMNSWFYMDGDRTDDPEILSYAPVNFHAFSTRFPHARVNLFISGCTPMDKHGFVRLPLSVSYELEMMKRADIIIFEVNPNLPVVFGDNEVHISEIDYLYEVDTKIRAMPEIPLTEKDLKIGKLVSSLIYDGDTLQMGIGALPNAVALALDDKKDLGVHTEMLSSAVASLAEKRIVTGRKKTLYPGKIVASFAFGSQDLYDFMDNNPSIYMLSGHIGVDPKVIARNDNMVSINTCLQIDLTGQVCSETIGTRQYSGTGGISDTAEGAIHARNGRSIIAAYATKKNDTVSTIVPTLAEGSVVSLSRNNLDYFVTEYGIAELKGRTVRERVKSIIGVAHPRFREDLLKKALSFGMIFKSDLP